MTVSLMRRAEEECGKTDLREQGDRYWEWEFWQRHQESTSCWCELGHGWRSWGQAQREGTVQEESWSCQRVDGSVQKQERDNALVWKKIGVKEGLMHGIKSSMLEAEAMDLDIKVCCVG